MQGIALAGWDRLRWEGSLAERWMRLRDRRTMLAALLLGASYLALVLLAACRLAGLAVRWPPLAAPMFTVTGGLLGWRLAMRALLVARAYGWRAGLLAIPRVLLANLIDMAAARRALWAYVPGAAPRWDKTAHVFPSALPCD